jgi:hypothetical protein
MKNPEFELRFEGEQAEANARTLADFLAQELPDWQTRVVPCPPKSKPDETRDAGIVIALVTLVLILPSALKDGLDLADRIQLKPKIERLIAWAKERRGRRLKNPFVVLPPHGTPLPLDQAMPEQLLDAVAAQTPKPHQNP